MGEEENYLKNYQAELLSLSAMLKQVQDNMDQKVMIPFGKFAFMQGQVSNKDKVVMHIGENWFVEKSLDDALVYISRRQAIVTNRILELTELSKQKELIYGDELNEDGEKFVEIRGHSDFHASLKTVEQSVPDSPIIVDHIERATTADDLALLEKIRGWEIEEKDNSEDERVRFYSSDDDDIIVNGHIRIKKDHRKSRNPPMVKLDDAVKIKSALKGVSISDSDSEKGGRKSTSKSVKFEGANFVDASDHSDNSEDIEEKAPSPKKEVLKTDGKTMKAKVVERGEFDSDNSDEDILEMDMMTKDLTIAYHRKRQQLISAGMIMGPKTDDEIYEELAKEDERREELELATKAAQLGIEDQDLDVVPEKKVSKFKSMRSS